MQIIPHDACVFESKPLPRAEMWHRNAQYFFTISPRGRGMDCHRTWESILLGSVPVIPDLPINSLFQTLPVVIVKDWAQVTPQFLEQEQQRILSQTFDFAPVLLETWRRRIHGKTDLPSLRKTYQDFMSMAKQDFPRR